VSDLIGLFVGVGMIITTAVAVHLIQRRSAWVNQYVELVFGSALILEFVVVLLVWLVTR
jgi:hypothetical protein